MTSAAPAAASRDVLRPVTIVLFWLPLAATWLMMGLEGPYVAAFVARMPDAAYGLAAFGVATALAWLIESPVMMLLTASTALVRDRASYLALRRFAWMLNALVTVGMLVLALPPVFRFVGEGMIGLPPEISRLAHTATVVLIFWPAAIGYRRFYQGILVRYGLTRRVAYGTVARLLSMSVTAALLAVFTSLSGAILGATALLAGVIAEAVASRWMARHIVRSLEESAESAEGAQLDQSEIARFYFPLALTSILSMALLPLVTFGLGRGRMPIESLAVWPVVGALVFLFRSGGIAYQEVAIALTGIRGEHAAVVGRTARWLGLIASLSLAVVVFTPLERIWLERVSGLPGELALLAVWPLRLLILLPALDFLLSIQRVPWIHARRTGVITAATGVDAAGLAAALLLTIGGMNMVGALGGAIAMVTGRLAANVFLFLYAKQQDGGAQPVASG
jgi:progressive ankylosis protein